VVVLLPEHGTIEVKAGYPPEDVLGEADIAAAKWAWEHDRPAGRGADTLPGAKRLFLPMRTGRGAIGVLGLDSDKVGPLLSPDQRRLLDALMVRPHLRSNACISLTSWIRRNAEWKPTVYGQPCSLPYRTT